MIATANPAEKARVLDYVGVSLVLIYVWRVQDLFPVLGALQMPTVVSLAALGIWVMGGHLARTKARLPRDPIVKILTFILVWMVLSIPGGVYPGLSFRFVLTDHVKTYLMMLVILSSIRGLRDVERLILANVVGALIYCVTILTTFEVEAGGRLGDLYYYDSNDLAMLICMALPMAIYFIGKRGNAGPRLLALGSVGVFLMAIVQTGSRGGFLALIGVGLFLLFGFRAIKARVRFGAVAAGIAMLMTVAGPQYWELMGTLLNPTEDYNWSGNNEVGRMAVWTRGMGYMASNPVLGVGANAFPVAEGTLSPLAGRQALGIGLKWSAAHNSFVQIGAELGGPGLIAFILLLVQLARANWRHVRSAKGRKEWTDDASLGQALNGSLIAYLIGGFFLSQAYSAMLYLLCGITAGLAFVSKRGMRPVVPSLLARMRPPVLRPIRPPRLQQSTDVA